MMRIYLAADHAGFEMKEAIKKTLSVTGHEIIDCGAERFDKTDDYPDFIHTAASALSKDPAAVALLFGGSGQGEAMVANRYPGVRAAVYYGGPREMVTLSREHNNANALSIGARFLSIEDAEGAITLWLNTKFSEGDRHMRRIANIEPKRA